MRVNCNQIVRMEQASVHPTAGRRPWCVHNPRYRLCTLEQWIVPDQVPVQWQRFDHNRPRHVQKHGQQWCLRIYLGAETVRRGRVEMTLKGGPSIAERNTERALAASERTPEMPSNPTFPFPQASATTALMKCLRPGFVAAACCAHSDRSAGAMPGFKAQVSDCIR